MHPRSADPATPDIGPRASGRADPSGHCVAGRPRFGTADAGASESVEVAASYVEAEALADPAKHAQASEVTACDMHPEMTTTGNTNTSLTVPAIAGGRQPLSALTRAFDRAETARRCRSPPYSARRPPRRSSRSPRRWSGCSRSRSTPPKPAASPAGCGSPACPPRHPGRLRLRRRPGVDRKLIDELAHLPLPRNRHQRAADRTTRRRQDPPRRRPRPRRRHAGYRTYFTTAADLAARCHRAAIEGRWATTMRFFAGPTLLVIDELGYLPLPAEAASALFQVVSQRLFSATKRWPR